MSLKDDVIDAKKEINELKEQSWAMTILSDYKATNKRMFVILIIVLFMWFATLGYLVYILNDINTTTDIIDIDDFESIDNSNFKIGNDLWAKSQ